MSSKIYGQNTWLNAVDAADKGTKFVPTPEFSGTSASEVVPKLTGTRANELIGSDAD